MAGAAAPSHRPLVRVAAILTALAVLATGVVAFELITGSLHAELMRSGLVWGVILAAVPGLVAAHLALTRAAHAERDQDLLPAGTRPQPIGALTRAPLTLLSIGYATIGVGVVIGIIHAVEVL